MRKNQWPCLIGVLSIIGPMCSLAGDIAGDNLIVAQHSRMYGRVELLYEVTPTNGLVLQFGFSTNSSSVADESGAGNTGTVYGATWTTNGQSGGGYDFDGNNDYVEVQGSESLDLRSNLTLTGWVYYKGEGVGSGFVLSKKYSSGLQYGLMRYNTSYGAQGHKFVASFLAGSWADYVSDYVLDDNQWYFLTATYDRQDVKLFVNGVLNKMIAETDLIDGDSTSRVTIGADANFPNWNEFTQAIIDDVRVYNRALSDGEIWSLYVNTKGGYTSTNVFLRVDGAVQIKRLIRQGDISMGAFTNEP